MMTEATDTRPFTRYLLWASGTILVLALMTAALSVVIDPYRIFGTPEIAGINQLKPRINQQMDMSRIYQLERVAPKTLLLGNSRVEIGFDPESPAFPATMQPVFNAGSPGRGMDTYLLLLRTALAVRRPETVIIGLDYIDFPPIAETPISNQRGGAGEERLLVDGEGQPNPARPLRQWKDRLQATLTIDALIDSLLTVADQHPQRAATVTARGFNPMNDYRVLVGREGYHRLFAQKDAYYDNLFRRMTPVAFDHPDDHQAFRDLRAILDLAQRHDIALRFVIYPYHARFLKTLERNRQWESFESWKRALVQVIDPHDLASGGRVTLTDFSGFGPLTTEAPPPPGNRDTTLTWYWEAGHFKDALGGLVITRLVGGGTGSGFGRDLTAANVDQVLAEIRAGRDGWHLAHRD